MSLGPKLFELVTVQIMASNLMNIDNIEKLEAEMFGGNSKLSGLAGSCIFHK
jgi:hypothetical protein